MEKVVVANFRWAAKSMRGRQVSMLSLDSVCLQAHGGSILEHGSVFYWYGEKKDGLTYNTTTNGWLD